MVLIEDTGNQRGKHDLKNQMWANAEIEVIRLPLIVGDYVMVNSKISDMIARKEKRGVKIQKADFVGLYTVAVDTKRNIQELCQDVCTTDHERFREECIRAMNSGIQLYVLVENEDGITNLRELHSWVNPRLWIKKYGKQVYPKATRGVTLMKSCYTMELKYGVKFLFCHPEESAQKVIELLGGKT